MNDEYPPIHHRRHHLRHSPTRLGEKNSRRCSFIVYTFTFS